MTTIKCTGCGKSAKVKSLAGKCVIDAGFDFLLTRYDLNMIIVCNECANKIKKSLCDIEDILHIDPSDVSFFGFNKRRDDNA